MAFRCGRIGKGTLKYSDATDTFKSFNTQEQIFIPSV